MTHFFSQSYAELVRLCESLEVPAVHARTLMANAYKDFLETPWVEGFIPQKLSAFLQENYATALPEAAEEHVSQYDGSVKFLFLLHDGNHIESVLMPEKNRITLCLSSQVGCRQACTFCHTGRMGLVRQLTVDEIVGQLVMANRWVRRHPEWLQTQRLAPHTRITNVVFMGMGEPLDNLESLTKAVDLFIVPQGLGLSLKRVAVSTAGHLDGLKEFLQRFPKAAIAFSLHATTPGERSRLMPINRRWPMEEVLGYLREHYQQHHPDGWLLIQYTVISGVNDTLEHAQRIVELLQGIPVKVNLIPLNEVGPSRFASPDPGQLHRFRDEIHQAGLRVMIRYSKGQDIAAACGQLVVDRDLVVKTPKTIENISQSISL